jgi:hypothetical protein
MAPETLNQAIIEFLNSASAHNKLARCNCGAAREYRKTTFFYDGKSWQVELPVCPKCTPVSNVSPHDA